MIFLRGRHGLSVIPLFLLVGDLRLSQVVEQQAGTVKWLRSANWFVFQSPMTAFSFVIFLGAAFAETNRTPFDLPRRSRKLAGGY